MPELGGHEVKGLIPAHRLKGAALFAPHHGLGDALLGVEHGNEQRAFKTQQARIVVVGVALNGNGLAVFNAHHNPAASAAVTAYALDPFVGFLIVRSKGEGWQAHARGRRHSGRHGKKT